MMRQLKIVGLAFVAILALNAVVASAASADDKLTAEEYPTTLTGGPDEGTGVVTSTAGNVSCTGVQYKGTLTAASSTISMTPSFTGCTAMGFPGTIHMNGCSYLFHLNAGSTTQGTIDIACPEGKEITGTGNPVENGLTPKCILHIKPQTGLGTLSFTNIGAGATRELTIDANIVGIHYTHTKGTGLGACSEGTGTNGSLTSRIKVTGESGSKHIAIFMSTV